MNITTIVQFINIYRALYCSPPVAWWNETANFAQSWANSLASRDAFEHSPSSRYGENCAYFYVPDVYDDTYYIMRAMDAFMLEYKNYDFKNPGFTAGHFTAMVWESTKFFGVGVARSKSGRLMVVFEFYPPGNIGGLYPYNVKACNKNMMCRPSKPLC